MFDEMECLYRIFLARMPVIIIEFKLYFVLYPTGSRHPCSSLSVAKIGCFVVVVVEVIVERKESEYFRKDGCGRH